MKDSTTRHRLIALLSGAILIVVWQILSMVIGAGFVLPSPIIAFKEFFELLKEASFYRAMLNTLRTALISFLISFALGLVFAILANKQKWFHYMMMPLTTVTRTLPIPGIILVIFVVFGTKYAAAIIGFLVIFPLIYTQLYTAILSVDKKLIEMARIYKIPQFKQITQIYLPVSMPYIFASVSSSFGLNIKVIISAEVLSLSFNTIGYNIKYCYNMFQSEQLFAWLIAAVLMSIICETVINIIAAYAMPFKYDLGKRTAAALKRVTGFFKKGVKNDRG